jgi:hypothetical protein
MREPLEGLSEAVAAKLIKAPMPASAQTSVSRPEHTPAIFFGRRLILL